MKKFVKPLAIAFAAVTGTVIMAVTGLAVYGFLNHETVYECENESNDTGAEVVQWKLPNPLTPERVVGSYSLALIHGSNVIYEETGQASGPLQKKADEFCETGSFKVRLNPPEPV